MARKEKIDIYEWDDKILGLYYKDVAVVRYETAREIKDLRHKYNEMNKGQTQLPGAAKKTKKKKTKKGGKKDGS